MRTSGPCIVRLRSDALIDVVTGVPKRAHFRLSAVGTPVKDVPAESPENRQGTLCAWSECAHPGTPVRSRDNLLRGLGDLKQLRLELVLHLCHLGFGGSSLGAALFLDLQDVIQGGDEFGIGLLQCLDIHDTPL